MRRVEVGERTRVRVIGGHEVSAVSPPTPSTRHEMCVDQGYTTRAAILGLRFALWGVYRLKKGQNARSYYTTPVREY
jgi:hypothetical protein